jgi:tyrosyl-tRNA synthetase
MAFEIVKLIKGEAEAQKAQDYFVKTFSKKELPDEVTELSAKSGEKIIDFMVRAGLAQSKADARRKIEQGGVSIDGKNISDWKMVLDRESDGKVLKVGKKDFRKILIL